MVRRRGLMSHSRWKICCQVPSTGFPSATGTVKDGPSSVACKCEWPLPSCQARSCPYWRLGGIEFVQQVRQVFEQARFEFDGAQRAAAAQLRQTIAAEVEALILGAKPPRS